MSGLTAARFDDGLRRVAAKIMATGDGAEFYNRLLAEWERISANAGKAQTNDLLRQFIGQAEGVRWVIETLAGAQTEGGANANGLSSVVSPSPGAPG
jgi:hypothetical protein